MPASGILGAGIHRPGLGEGAEPGDRRGRAGVHILRQQGDGVPDRDDTFDKLVNWVIGIFLGAGAVAILAALGLSVTASC